MRRPNPKKVLRSATGKLAETAEITKKEGSLDGKPFEKTRVALNNCKPRMGSMRKRVRDDTPVTEDGEVDVQFGTDIIWEILLRVPIEALLRCRCVCKTWCSITKDPSFINMQMNISSKRPPRFICQTGWDAPHTEDDQLLLLNTEEGKTRKMPVNANLIRNRKVIFSYNGLLCFFHTNRYWRQAPLEICNPITKECIKLPQIDKVNRLFSSQVGFCFVPARNKHIVVQVVSTSSKGTCFYIMASGESSWRWLTHLPCLNIRGHKGETIYWNNAFYWIASTFHHDRRNECILSFDTIRETFQVILCPGDLGTRYNRLSLLVLNGCLTLIRYCEKEMQLWEVMGDRVGELSLVCCEIYDIDTKEFSLLSRLNKNENLLSSFPSDSRVGYDSCSGFVAASNDMKQLTNLKIDGLPDLFNPFPFTPSLISVHSMGFPGYHLRS